MKQKQFLQEVSAHIKPIDETQVIILLHLMSDWLEVLNTLDKIGKVVLIIAIPYSINLETLEIVRKKYSVVTPSLASLLNNKYLLDVVKKYIQKDSKILFIEIGGYFAKIADELEAQHPNQVLGFIEDTEAGHRNYEKLHKEKALKFPVVSVARSWLKLREEQQVGVLCVKTFFELLAISKEAIHKKTALILGFGKIGVSVAETCHKMGLSVYVNDINTGRNDLAKTKGFIVQEKSTVLANADFIFGASGNFSIKKEDFTHVKQGAYLISCSSKRMEFNFKDSGYVVEKMGVHIEKLTKSEQAFFLVNYGEPVNFINNSRLLGPSIYLTQAEILCSIETLLSRTEPGIYENSDEKRKTIEKIWLKYFNSNENKEE